MRGDGLFAEGVEFGAVGRAGVEHVAAGEFVHGELWRDGGGELVLREDAAHERAAQVVPAVHDDDVELGVGGEGFAEIGDGAAAEVRAVAVPETADIVGEQVVAVVDLPADGDGIEVDHGLG